MLVEADGAYGVRNRILITFAIIWAAVVGYKLFNPASSDGKKFFHQLPAQNIHYVELGRTSNGAPAGHSVRIENRDDLNRFISIWGGVDTFAANHPRTTWSVAITINTDQGNYGGTLRGTSNQGVIFDFDRSPTGWAVNDQYQLAKSPIEVEAVLRSLRVAPNNGP